jgi:hypothetical protein
MRRAYFLSAVMAVMVPVSAVAATDWKPVQEILGRKGEVDDGVLRVTFERSGGCQMGSRLEGLLPKCGGVVERWRRVSRLALAK